LLNLAIARQALDATDQNAARAMQTVINEALERLRPEGQRSFTASEWLLYNILELRFVRGLRVRDIARRLAMSESDLYRKQRVAIDALARQLVAMEAEPGNGGTPPGHA
jgi:predicted DNA-binding transcriptional regulator